MKTDVERVKALVGKAELVDELEVSQDRIMPVDLDTFEKTRGELYYLEATETLFKRLPEGRIISFKYTPQVQESVKPKVVLKASKEAFKPSDSVKPSLGMPSLEIPEIKPLTEVLSTSGLEEQLRDLQEQIETLQTRLEFLEIWKEQVTKWQQEIAKWSNDIINYANQQAKSSRKT